MRGKKYCHEKGINPMFSYEKEELGGGRFMRESKREKGPEGVCAKNAVSHAASPKKVPF